MFDKKNNKIIVLLYENVMLYPPVLNLIECMINNGYRVHFIGQNAKELPEIISKSELFSNTEVVFDNGKSKIARIKNRSRVNAQFRDGLIKAFEKNDIVWTVNPLVVRALGKTLKEYKNRHVMELMELFDWMPFYKNSKFLSFDLAGYARNAWKLVVPERNRAYIQKAFWNLKDVPYVLPNKPYYYEIVEPTDDTMPIITQMKNEKRKIIVYLGVFDPDRNLKAFAEAVSRVSDEYCLYLFGKQTPNNKALLEELCSYEGVKYMGFFNPPKHLQFLKHAQIALVPYKPDAIEGKSFSKLNALYCAPNKIYEYAGSDLPMLGTDVLGLRDPFEKYNIGVCCSDLKPETIVRAIRYIDNNHSAMTQNCHSFYASIDIDDIVNRIINE